MATILFTWELGGGLGHTLPMRPLAEGLVKAGHTVYVALRHLHTAARVLGHTGVLFLQAPYADTRQRYPRTLTVTQILANVGWGSYPELFGLACGWRNMLRLVKPDLILFDHSPTAMLASLGLPCRRIVTGNGFFNPPRVRPFPIFREHDALRGFPETIKASEQRLAEVEDCMLELANAVLAPWRPRPLDCLAQIYSEMDESFLATFPELDHYAPRDDTRYWGTISGAAGGKAVRWADGPGKRLFVYLRPCDALAPVLRALRDRGDSAVVFAEGIDHNTKGEYQSDRIVFEDQRVDLARVARECDAAIHHGNHGTVSELLLAGKPMLSLPNHLEQTLTARAVGRIGAGVSCAAKCPTEWPDMHADEIRQKLDQVLTNPAYATAASQFAATHADFDANRQQEEMLQRTIDLLPRAAPRRAPVSAPARPRHAAAPAARVGAVRKALFCG